MVRRAFVLIAAAAGLVAGTTLTPAEEAAAVGGSYFGGPAVASSGTATPGQGSTGRFDRSALDREINLVDSGYHPHGPVYHRTSTTAHPVAVSVNDR